jgi:toxin secretion/phage lysis holin
MLTFDPVKFDPVAVIGAAAGVVVGLWVGIGVFVQALLIAMVADVATGLIAATVDGSLSSAASGRGFAKKGTALILVMLTAWLSLNLSTYLGEGFPGADAVAGAFILTEVISILENAKRTGINLGPLEKVLAVARQAQPPPTPPQQEAGRG